MNEIEEFYSYIEMPQAAENMKAFEGSFKHGASGLHRIRFNWFTSCLFLLLDCRRMDESEFAATTTLRRVSP
jgi:hypothetical protein